jgi:hypothetical protein
MKGELANEQIGPIGVELLRGQFLQAQATLMFLRSC